MFSLQYVTAGVGDPVRKGPAWKQVYGPIKQSAPDITSLLMTKIGCSNLGIQLRGIRCVAECLASNPVNKSALRRQEFQTLAVV